MNRLISKTVLLIVTLMSLLSFTVNAQSWLLAGNSGTSSSTNFVGTKDNQALVFRTNNAERMRILSTGNTGIGTNSPVQKLDVNSNINIRSGFGLFFENHRVLKVDSVNGNLFLGNRSGLVNTGFYNTATGSNALASNTSGIRNTANGYYSLFSNTSGGENTAFGFESLYTNSTGIDNTATGANALYSNLTGSFNTAGGFNSLYYNTTGWGNTALGANALNDNNGNNNVAIGSSAMFYNLSGSYNTALGTGALSSNTSGNDNTATGQSALLGNTVGYDNTANGLDALYINSSGAGNAAFGTAAMFSNSTGGYNTAVGTSAMYNNTTAYYNCAIGYLAMAYAVPGWNNTAVGAFAGPDPNVGEVYNSIALGEGAVTTAPNQVRIGNWSTTSIGGYTNWTNISDGRVKKNIRGNVPGLTFINKLKPVTYNLDLDAADKIIERPERKDKDGKVVALSTQELNDRNTKQQIVYTGFVAQDVEKAAKELNYDFSGVDAPKNDKDLYGLRYSEFVVPLVKAVQELSRMNDEKDSTINDLEARLSRLEAMVDEQPTATGSIHQRINSGALEQNVPNPFSNVTTINYTLPDKYSSAQIIITDQNGQTIKALDLSGSGKAGVTIDVTGFSAGTYQYALIIDGQKIDVKQMVLTK